MISTEKALDLLPYAVEVYEKIKLDEYIAKKRKIYTKEPVTQMEAGIEMFKYACKQSAKIKDEIIEMAAIIADKPAQEIRKQSVMLALDSLKEVFLDKDLINFFKQAM